MMVMRTLAGRASRCFTFVTGTASIIIDHNFTLTFHLAHLRLQAIDMSTTRRYSGL